jgi:hypothetical protein
MPVPFPLAGLGSRVREGGGAAEGPDREHAEVRPSPPPRIEGGWNREREQRRPPREWAEGGRKAVRDAWACGGGAAMDALCSASAGS